MKETAAAVTAAGGDGRAVACDHRNDGQVRALVRRIAAESGRFAEHLDLTDSQSPEGLGRVVAALAADPGVLELTGQAVFAAALAERYGVDIRG